MAVQTLAPPPASTDKAAVRRVALLVGLSVILGTFISAVTNEKIGFLYKETLGLSAGQVATLGIFLGIPAYLRPFLGAWSDVYALFGYHRRSYFLLGVLVEIGGYLCLALLHQYHYWTVFGLLLVTGGGAVLFNIVLNAVLVAVGNRTGTFGLLYAATSAVPVILSIVYTAHLSGYVTQHWSYQRCFITSVALLLLRLPLVLLLDDRRVDAVRGTRHTPEEQAARSAARRADRARTVATLGAAARSGGLWVVLGLIFYLIITPGTNTPQFYYVVDSLHFSKQFLGDLGAYSGTGSFVGGLIFALASRRLSTRTLVLGSWLCDCLIYLVLLCLHDRTSAHAVYFVIGVVGAFYSLFLITLSARACPPGIEATVFGLLLSAQALGGTLGDKIGASLYDGFGPHGPHPGTVAHGWAALLWFGFGFTVLAGAFLPFLPAWARSRETWRPPAAASAEGEGGRVQ